MKTDQRPPPPSWLRSSAIITRGRGLYETRTWPLGRSNVVNEFRNNRDASGEEGFTISESYAAKIRGRRFTYRTAHGTVVVRLRRSRNNSAAIVIQNGRGGGRFLVPFAKLIAFSGHFTIRYILYA